MRFSDKIQTLLKNFRHPLIPQQHGNRWCQEISPG